MGLISPIPPPFTIPFSISTYPCLHQFPLTAWFCLSGEQTGTETGGHAESERCCLSHLRNHRPFGCVAISKTPLVSKYRINEIKTICHGLSSAHLFHCLVPRPAGLALSSLWLFALIYSCTSMFCSIFSLTALPHFLSSLCGPPSLPFTLYFLNLPVAPCDLNYNM